MHPFWLSTVLPYQRGLQQSRVGWSYYSQMPFSIGRWCHPVSSKLLSRSFLSLGYEITSMTRSR
jgi:hypothetical protein